MSDEIERTITIPLRATKMAPRSRRALRAIKEIRVQDGNVLRSLKVLVGLAEGTFQLFGRCERAE